MIAHKWASDPDDPNAKPGEAQKCVKCGMRKSSAASPDTSYQPGDERIVQVGLFTGDLKRVTVTAGETIVLKSGRALAVVDEFIAHDDTRDFGTLADCVVP